MGQCIVQNIKLMFPLGDSQPFLSLFTSNQDHYLSFKIFIPKLLLLGQ